MGLNGYDVYKFSIRPRRSPELFREPSRKGLNRAKGNNRNWEYVKWRALSRLPIACVKGFRACWQTGHWDGREPRTLWRLLGPLNTAAPCTAAPSSLGLLLIQRTRRRPRSNSFVCDEPSLVQTCVYYFRYKYQNRGDVCTGLEV